MAPFRLCAPLPPPLSVALNLAVHGGDEVQRNQTLELYTNKLTNMHFVTVFLFPFFLCFQTFLNFKELFWMCSVFVRLLNQ